MHLRYHDILRNVPQPPLWWFNGVPRYERFSPELVGTFEVALVHTECRECRTRYDVAVRPRPPLFHKLRNLLSYTNSLEIGDPPFACRELGSNCGPGYSMSSLEIRVLEFWHRSHIGSEWKRDTQWEQALVDADWDAAAENGPPEPIFLRIHNSEKKDEWRRARESGDFQAMVKLLIEFGCERPADVANMVDLDYREESARRERWALTEARLGKGA